MPALQDTLVKRALAETQRRAAEKQRGGGVAFTINRPPLTGFQNAGANANSRRNIVALRERVDWLEPEVYKQVTLRPAV